MISEIEFKKAWEVIKTRKTVLIVTHASPDPDAVCSAGALSDLLNAENIKSTIIILKDDSEPHLEFGNEVFVVSDSLPPSDGFVLLDAEAPFRAGKVIDNLLEKSGLPSAVIDHHQASGSFGDIVLSDEEATSTCELIFQLSLACLLKLSQETLDKLYAGLMSDTGFLQFPAATTANFEVATSMRKLGADPSYARERIIHNSTLSRTHFFGELLSRITVSGQEPQLSFSFAGHTEFKQNENDLGQLKTPLGWEMLKLKGVELSFFLRESELGRYKVSLRGSGKYNCADLAERLGGGGSHNAAGASATGTLDEAIAQIEKAFAQLVS